MLGGNSNKIHLYPSLPCFDGDPDEVVRQVTHLYQQGYRHIKMHEKEVEAIVAATRALPKDAVLMVDTNCAWSFAETERNLFLLGKEGVALIEEPIFPPEDIESIQRLTSRNGVKIALGENVNNVNEFKRYIDNGSIDVIQPSVTKIGGVSPIIELMHYVADKPHINVLPHCFYYGPGMLASAHLVASMSHQPYLEVPYLHFDEHLYPFMAYQPEMLLPETPGLGYEPNELVLEKTLLMHS